MTGRGTPSLIGLGVLCILAALAPLNCSLASDVIDIVVVGDTGFNSASARVTPEGGYKQGQLVHIAEALSGIRHELDADLVLANLETAVTARNDIAGLSKRFVFRTHPDAIAAFVAAGINAFSLANNHALDYRQRGAGETLLHLDALRGKGLVAFPGLGRTREEAAAPHRFSIAEVDVASASIGIGGWGLPAYGNNAGMLQYPGDFETVRTALQNAHADLRILSVHYGQEFQPATSQSTRNRFRSAIAPDGLTIISGHHKHIATGVATVETPAGGIGIIFYGLGNFLHLGMQNMGRHDLCHDFGLLGRVQLARTANGDLSLISVRVVPLTDMHRATKPLPPEPAALRIAALNHLSSQLDHPDSGTAGLRFSVQEDGSGLWCNPQAEAGTCSGVTVPAVVPQNTSARIANACRRVLTR
jgi:poly-gamma-glutamate capsule biosynthesis protein CapA/YwtB (metallophosphatase superfamily)